MKRLGRSRLLCTKKLSNQNIERFSFNVSTEAKDAAKKEYERRRYDVKIIPNY